MRILTLLLFIVISTAQSFAQQSDIKLYLSDSLRFKVNGEIVSTPFTGGFNFPQFSPIDLNNDGKMDLIVFEKQTEVILTFINTGNPGDNRYEYAPQYEYIFTDYNIGGFAMFRDFNQNGKNDLFYLDNNSRIKVLMNITEPADTVVKFRKMGDLYWNNNSSGPIQYNILTGRSVDLPILADIDGDGDIDYIYYNSSFGSYGKLNLILNEQVELGLPNDTFAFRMADLCWGGFTESMEENDIYLFCPNFINTKYYRDGYRHDAGTTLLTIDMDNDGDVEMIMGNGGFKNLLYIVNGKKDLEMPYDTMISYTKSFPGAGTNEINMKYTPALFHFDVDGDGKKDLIAAPYFRDSSVLSESIWFIKNEGSNEFPNFVVKDKNFLTKETMDLGGNVSPLFWDINQNGLLDLLVVVEPDIVKEPQHKFTRIFRYNNLGPKEYPVFELVDNDFLNFSQFQQKGVTLTLGDINGNGLQDMIFGNETGRILLLQNISDSTGDPNPKFNLAHNNLINRNLNYYSAPTLFDYNLDGKLDLIIGSSSGFFSYYQNTSTENMLDFTLITDSLGNIRSNRYRTDFSPPDYEQIGFSQPLFLDLNGNGKEELISGSSSGQLKAWYISYNPNSTFAEASEFNGIINAELDTSWDFRLGTRIKVTGGNLRSDNKVDLLVGTSTGGFKFFSTPHIRTVGINEASTVPNKTFKVYPNPANTSFFIEIPKGASLENLNFDLIDLSGRTLMSQKIHSSVEEINSSQLQSGLYIGVIKSNGRPVSNARITIVR
jgi:hypothetical protein